MKLRRNRTRKFRSLLRNERKNAQRGQKWPDWKKDVRVAKYVSLLK
ncbi:MAG: hypothetical protein KGY42_04715 [Desulfobacterales bacterium]|nr:hypothetical protein [Desulfobacterales bacterium]MBS3755271.1 hypothetical protein [Desulfobacterales bacterium]